MLLENFQKACQNTKCTSFTNTQTGNISIVANPTSATYYSIAGGGYYVDVGFGDTAVTKDDYKLASSNAIDSVQLTYVSGVTTNVSPALRTAITIYRNDGNSDVTVKEVGFCTKSGTYASNAGQNAILARKVLSTPVVVPAGATMAFTYSIDLNFNESVNAA